VTVEMTDQELMEFIKNDLPQIVRERPYLKPILLDRFIEEIAPLPEMNDILEYVLVLRARVGGLSPEKFDRWLELRKLVQARQQAEIGDKDDQTD